MRTVSTDAGWITQVPGDRFGGVRGPGRLLATALVLAVACLMLTSAAAHAATGSISGKVTNNSATPLEDICVDAYHPSGGFIEEDFTGPDGTYTIPGLENASYRIEFSDCGDNNVTGEFYNNKPDFDSANPVAVTGGSETGGINAVLGVGGSISGTVTKSSALPLEDICVDVYDSSGSESSFGYTEPDGSYTIEGLPGGNHRIQFYDCGSNNVVSEYYNNKPDLASANRIAVTAGSEITGIDAALAPGGSISGTITDSSKEPLEDICVDAYDSSGDDSGSSYTEPDGSYAVEGLASGKHRIRFYDCGSSNVAGEYYDDKPDLGSATPVAVAAGSETGGINARLAPRGSQAGRGKARIKKAKVSGPRKVEMGKASTYRMKIRNSGNAKAEGVRLRVSGKGVRFKTSVGKISPGKVRKVRVRLKPKKRGTVRLTFRVTSKNAGGKTVKKKITVKR